MRSKVLRRRGPLARPGHLLSTLPFFVVAVLAGTASAQEPRSANGDLGAVPTLRASKAPGGITIDGRFDEPGWGEAEPATGFIQRTPDPGASASQPTEVRVLYDSDNLYVAMRMYDDDPDRIAAQLGRRGATGLYSDWAHVVIDSYRDRRTAFRFSVNPVGVKQDALHFDDVEEDPGWEAVWEVATQIDSLGWTAEFRIPYSQLRFENGAARELEWGVNFMRDVARLDERSTWAPQPPGSGRFVSLFGALQGIRDVASPRRLELTPYLLARGDRNPGGSDNPFRGTRELGADAGVDLTYGLGPSLTLTVTVNPDFGQVEVDPAVVNLTAFETFFPERRPFFLEGADIFRFPINLGDGGDETLFYTRRIGRSPQASVPDDAVHSDVPSSARILGATKLSGRMGDGWSVGALNAVTGAQRARWVDEEGMTGTSAVEPLTNYGVLRIGRDFREGGSAFGAMLTTVHRDLSADRLRFLPGEAYAGGMDLRHRFSEGMWEARGWVTGSHVRGDVEAIERLQRAPGRYFQRPDADHLELDDTRDALSGVGADLTLARVAGSWRGGAILHTRSPGLELNDLGFQQDKDRMIGAIWLGRVSFEQGRYLRRWNVFSNLYSGWTWGGERIHSGGNVNGSFEARSGWGGYAGVEGSVSAIDPVATRGGPALHRPGSTNFWAGMYTDRRRSVFAELSGDGARRDEPGHGRLAVGPSITIRPSPRLQLSIGPRWAHNVDPAQYVRREVVDGDAHHLFGRIKHSTVSMNARLNVTFTPDFTLELFAQPFLSAGEYSEFRRVDFPGARDFDERFHTFAIGDELRKVAESGGRATYGYFRDGTSDEPAYTFQDPGFRIRSLRGNAVLRWEYRPGSTLFFVWQQSRELTGPARRGLDLGRDLDSLIGTPGDHVFLIKATYWVGG